MAEFGLPLGLQPLAEWSLPGRLEPMGKQISVPRPWPKHVPASRAILEMGFQEKWTEGGRKEGRKGGSQETQN